MSREGNLFQLELVAQLAAPTTAVWATLTDYPNLHRLSPALQLSEVVASSTDGSHRVRTLSHICVWIFCGDLEHLQRMRRSRPPGRLVAQSLPEGSDFDFGLARWILRPEADGTRLHFVARLQPSFWVPPLLGPILVQEGLRNTALEVLQGLEREARAVACRQD